MKFLGLLFLAVVTQNAFALNLQGYRFTDSYRYSLLEDSLQEKFPGKYVATASLGFVNSPFYVSNKSVSQIASEIINYQYVLTAGATYYYSPDLAFGLDLNAMHSEVLGDYHNSLADTVLKAKMNLYRDEQFSFALAPKLFIPTGKTDNFSTINSLGGSISAIGEYALERWHFLASVGFFHGDNNKLGIVDYRNLVLASLGVSYDINQKWNMNAEALKNFTTVNDYRQDEADYYLTAKHKTCENLSVFFGGGIAGLSEVDRNNYTVFAGVKLFEEPAPVVVPKPAPVAIVAKPKPVLLKREDEKVFGAVTKADDLYFPNAISALQPIEIVKLKELLGRYKDRKKLINHIVIEGYASHTGTHAGNLILSRQRAENVKSYLMKGGVPEDIMTVVAYGDSILQHKEEWKNRKVQFRIYE